MLANSRNEWVIGLNDPINHKNGDTLKMNVCQQVDGVEWRKHWACFLSIVQSIILIPSTRRTLHQCWMEEKLTNPKVND